MNAAGAALGTVGFVYIVGAFSLSLRYDGLGLPGHQTAAVTPREVLLAAGLRTLVVWVLAGVAVAFVLAVGHQWLAGHIHRRWRTRWGWIAVGALAIALLFVRVLWPLALLVGVLLTTHATMSWDAFSARRVVVTVLAIGLVAVAYEADRITYLVEETCVVVKEPAGKRCGTLVGQHDRGFHLGVGVGSKAPYVLFVPAFRVLRASATKRPARVSSEKARQRRKLVIRRVFEIRVR